ncbi:MAG TPA: hypothetical protein VFV34_07745 [Blastocatellia bacterium]|nr:hypothetical protein [Blastocatellia bacterium]
MRYATIIITLLVTGYAFGAQGGKVESAGAFSDPAASEQLRGVLEQKGYRVSLPDGSALCEIWLRTSVPAAKAEPSGATYTGIDESSLVGVVSFLKANLDYRGQSIKPGAYTLRYALHPVDGNHMGISPIRDFLLLIPVAEDKDPTAAIGFKDLNNLSHKASGTNHAGVISLVSTEGLKSFPSVFENEVGHIVFAAKLKTSAGETPLAFVVKGVAEH